MISCFPEVKKNFGFGCMRLPMLPNGEVDLEQCAEMADLFLEKGFNYFDTAHGYIDGKSEPAIRAFLTSRHARSEYILTDKLTGTYFQSQEEIRPLLLRQLEACGVDYFDFYLMHSQNAGTYAKFKRCRAYETAFALKEEGLVRHVGISFHDKAEVLEQILTEYPQIEIVQIQFNYVDYEDAGVESRKVYEVAAKHGKPVIVMEPVKGGTLAALPADAQAVLDALHPAESRPSSASYALRFAADFENIRMVLSGMSTIEQMRDNTSFMQDYRHLSEEEKEAISKVREVFRSRQLIGCTACRYCVQENHCPMDILIPDMFALMNAKKQFPSWNQNFYYDDVLTTKGHGKASDCIRCGGCERVCPQHLPIRELLAQTAETFE